MTTSAASDSGRLLVEMVCDVCRVEGFTVDRNVESEKNAGNFVAIVASRQMDNKLQRIAFECWEKDSQVDARQIESFVKRLRDLGIPSGIYVSPKGFTGEAEYFARRLSIELWDLPKLKEHLKKIETRERTKVPGTLPVARTLPATIFSKQLENGRVLKMRSLPRLEFRPYYFAMFEMSVGKKKRGKGVVVLDGVDGRVCDAGMLEGQLKRLPSTGMFLDCLEVEPSVGHMPNLPDELGMSNTVTVAPTGIARDHVGVLVGEVLEKEAGIDLEDVELTVTDVSLLHIPIVTVELAAGTKSYQKIVQAATGKVIWDETSKCLHCETPSRAICEVCGSTACDEHVRICSSCQKHLCKDCVETKGVLSKQPFCPTCKNA
jgi:hypothetical protein